MFRGIVLIAGFMPAEIGGNSLVSAEVHQGYVTDWGGGECRSGRCMCTAYIHTFTYS